MSDETTWRERALRAEKEIGDAWEVMGQDRAGATSGRVDLGPVGGPYVTVEESRSYTLPEFLAEVTAALEADRKYIDSVRAAHNRLGRIVPESEGDSGPICCTDGCCGPGSHCCAHANPHTHEED